MPSLIGWQSARSLRLAEEEVNRCDVPHPKPELAVGGGGWGWSTAGLCGGSRQAGESSRRPWALISAEVLNISGWLYNLCNRNLFR